MARSRGEHDELTEQTRAMLAEAAEHHTQSTGRLEGDIAESARIRADAASEAEQVRGNAIAEAENRIATARKQAAAITARTQQEFSWRKQQLRRETELLQQRKQAVLSQLASLSELAQQTASSFPDLDEDADSPTSAGSAGGNRQQEPAQPEAEAEQHDPTTDDVPEDGTDRTVLKRYSAPTLPPTDETPEPAEGDAAKGDDQQPAEDGPAPVDSSTASSTEADDDLDIPMDGEPTLLAAPGRVPQTGRGTQPRG